MWDGQVEEAMDEATCKVMVRKPEGKVSFGGTRCRWEGDI
jgi:hypothetical protein